MIRRGLASALAPARALTMALACASCSAPATCDMEQFPRDEQSLETEERSGSLRLSEAHEAQTLNFRATLGELPELWPNDDMVRGSLPFELGLRYESEPFGGDGRTEMPRLSVLIAKLGAGTPSWPATSNYPGSALQFGSRLFEDCAFGSTHCEAAFSVTIQRLDGAPYPPINVSWRTSAEAQVSVCHALATDARLTLELAEP